MSATLEAPDFAAIKQRQRATWAASDYAVVGTTLQIVGERLCEAIDLRAGERVLDVAAGNGNGNATLAAARRFADVTSTDYVDALLDRGRERAAERLAVSFWQADAEALPFPDGDFDVAVSTFGVMFTPNQEKAAAELARGPQGRPRRPRQLDAGRFHRPALQDHRQARTAAGRRQIARALGHGRAPRRAVSRP
jgi:SAM-dependent methyltransferase